MKRIMAFAIDYFIFLIFYVIIDFFCLFLFLKTDSYLMNNNYVFVFGHYMVAVGGILLYIYCLVLDVITGIDIGKKAMKIEISPRLTVKKAFLHSFLKCCCGVVWPVTLCIYASTKKMPYDRWLGISIKEKD